VVFLRVVHLAGAALAAEDQGLGGWLAPHDRALQANKGPACHGLQTGGVCRATEVGSYFHHESATLHIGRASATLAGECGIEHGAKLSFPAEAAERKDYLCLKWFQ